MHQDHNFINMPAYWALTDVNEILTPGSRFSRSCRVFHINQNKYILWSRHFDAIFTILDTDRFFLNWVDKRDELETYRFHGIVEIDDENKHLVKEVLRKVKRRARCLDRSDA